MNPLKKTQLSLHTIDSFMESTLPFLKRPNDVDSPTLEDMHELMTQMNPISYGHTRNYLNGSVTKLSRYISVGVLSTKECVDFLIQQFGFEASLPLIKQLVWRIYFKHKLRVYPHAFDSNIEHYKTGLNDQDYARELPHDILNASTPNKIMNYFITTLIETGYLHNHARLYLASYIIHFRRIHWKVGADWMFTHLVDADIASHYCSWQWVASTGSTKPYLFNLENIQRYVSHTLPVDPKDNPELVGSYEELSQRLFRKDGHT